MLMFAHGFSVHFGTVVPPAGVDVTMIAPKGPGHLVRRTYERGQRDAGPGRRAAGRHRQGAGSARSPTAPRSAARSPASSRPRSRKRPRPTCSASRRCCAAASRELIRNGFETLVEAGYQPEIAYFECLHELKLIIDLIYEGGLSWMRYSVSDTAEWGDYQSGPRVVDEHAREQMRAGARRDPGRHVREEVDRRGRRRLPGVPPTSAAGADVPARSRWDGSCAR